MAHGRDKYFKTQSDFRKWLERNHTSADELWVGFYKVGSGKPSITWKQSVDEALCFGWIDGIRRSIDERSYKIRFTPRRPGSNWSKVNTQRVWELKQCGRMQPAGLKAFDTGRAKKRDYSYEEKERVVDAGVVKAIKAEPAAWEYWQTQPPWYQRTASFWVISAKKDETRQRRLARLIDDCVHGRRIMEVLPKDR